MRICLLAEHHDNPVLGAAVDSLAGRHDVSVADPRTLVRARGAKGDNVGGSRADLYLLKSRSPEARVVAHRAELAGARVVNRPSATAAALDRWAMATRLQLAGVCAPAAWAFPTLSLMWRDTVTRHHLPWPLVVKSRTSARGDLVTLVRGPAELRALLPAWSDEPVVAQQYVENDGFDVKVWVIGGTLWAARRAGALESCDKSSDVALGPDEMPAQWRETALRAGAALGLDLFGVDLLVRDGRAHVVDVNAFPGFRGAHDAAHTLVHYLETVLSTPRLVTP